MKERRVGILKSMEIMLILVVEIVKHLVCNRASGGHRLESRMRDDLQPSTAELSSTSLFELLAKRQVKGCCRSGGAAGQSEEIQSKGKRMA